MHWRMHDPFFLDVIWSTPQVLAARMQFQRGRQLPCYRGNRPVPYVAHVTFDPIFCATVFPGADLPYENEELSKLLMDVHSRLTPSVDEQQAVATLVTKVLECLEAIALDRNKFSLGHIEEIRSIGSFKKGTMLAGHCLADIVVVLRGLPSFETTMMLGFLLRTEFLAKETGEIDEPPECLPRSYGFDFAYLGACVRVAFTTHSPEKPEPGIHISAPDQNVARAAILHARWVEEKASHTKVVVGAPLSPWCGPRHLSNLPSLC
uniref:DZF domain-containing protein n=1 Tax=Mesocestoides corti TaxID=53468 RepID=A0A5K3FB58_MESCO